MKWMLILTVVFCFSAKAEYYNTYASPYDAYAGAYNTGGTSLYNLMGTGNSLNNFYNTTLPGYNNQLYNTGLGTSGLSYYPYGQYNTNSLLNSSLYNPWGNWGNSYNNYYTTPIQTWGSPNQYGSNWGWGYSIYQPGGYDYYYIPSSGYINYNPVTVNVYNVPQAGLGGCNGVTIPCGTEIGGTPVPTPPTVNPPVFNPNTQTVPVDPNRIRIPRTVHSR